MWTILAQFIQLASGVILIKVLTSELEVAAYGLFALVMSVSAFVLTVPFTAIQQGFYRYRSIYNKKNKQSEFYISMVLGVSALIILYIFVAYIILQSFSFGGYWVNHFFLIALFIVSEIYKVFTRSIVNADRQRKTYAKSILAEFIIKLVLLSFITYFFSNLELDFVISTYTFANFVSVFICSYFNIDMLKNIEYKLFKLIWFRVLIFSSPLLLWASFGWIRDMSLRWFLELHGETSEVAMFTAISSIAIIIPMVMQSIIGAYFIPIMYENGRGENSNKLKHKFNILILILILIGILLFLFLYAFSGFIVEQLTDSIYVIHSWALPWMFISYYLFCCGMISATSLLVDFKPKKLFLPNLVSGLVVLCAGLFFIKEYGLEAAVFSYCISYISYFLLTFFIVYKNR
ncbi:hypothetical protein [Pseudoalteromonas sp. SG44-8]|uniref:hypothetical protein n=1 Tax=Pseudoalteromonas sp. SG44-8 TaxID=2760958 RepID=UPI001602408D|nr:hypothetical protein [Pseudoalteromonas sp. SG44-8]